MKAGPAVDTKRNHLELLSGYIKLQKLKLSMERHEKMIAGWDNVADSAHLFDSLLHDAEALSELPGPEEEEDEFFLEAIVQTWFEYVHTEPSKLVNFTCYRTNLQKH
jgi:hypothetical protein